MKVSSSIAYYIRTSSLSQDPGRQEDKAERNWIIYDDVGVSGRVAFEDRPMGRRLLKDIEKGKIKEVRVDTLDRLGRNTENILASLRKMHQFGICVHIKKEGITTLVDGKENYVSKLLCSILSSISEMELMRIKERTLEGIERGKRLNVYKGRKPGAVEPIQKFRRKEKVRKIKLMLEENIPVRKICSILECSPNYVSKVKATFEL